MTTAPPNYTQIPNDLLGNIERGNTVEPGLMATLEGSQLKVYLAVCRMTIGYHQDSRRASLSMIETFTGLSRPAVNNAAKALEQMNLIERAQDGGTTLWKLVVNSVNQDYGQPVVKPVNQLVNSVNQTSKLSLPPSKKETLKETKKETTATTATAFSIYENEIGMLTQMSRDLIIDYCNDYSEEWFIQATGIAVAGNKRNLRYIGGILKRWKAQGGPQHDKPNGAKSNGQNRTNQAQQQPAEPEAGTWAARRNAELRAAGGET